MTAQLTIRASDELIARVRYASAAAGRSMNDYVMSVLDAATNPDLAGTEAARLRERLSQAGLLATPTRLSGHRPSTAAVEAAGRRAATGRSLADHVSDGR
jgi:plasmid stability protein